MCFKNLFVEVPYQPPPYDQAKPVANQSTGRIGEMNQSLSGSDLAINSAFSPSESPLELEELFNSYPSVVPSTPLSFVDSYDASPTSMHSSTDCLSPMNDFSAYVNNSTHQRMSRHNSTSSVFGRKPVFNGHTRPPEYMYQPPSGYTPQYPGYLPMQGTLDGIVDGNQYSPGSDLETKYGVSPATSLTANSLQAQSLCKVCGDVASGNHFGVQSCEACKSFFRRSVRAGARYSCRANRMCSIEKHTRNRCQYCRLQKCLQTGMRREAVQEERTPPVSKLQRASTPTQLGYHPPPSSSNAFVSPTLPPPSIPNNFQHSFEGPASPIVPNFMTQNRLFGSLPNLKVGLEQERQSGFNSFFPTGLETYTTTHSRPDTPNNTDIHLHSSQSSNPAHVSPSVLVEADMVTDLPPENVTNKEGGVKLEDIFEGARQSLLRIIEWGKRIPAFMSLSLDDQVKLLKSSWCEHVLLKLSMRISAKSNTLLLSSGITCHKDQIEDPEFRKVVERIINDVSYWFDMMHIDRVEMACLKGIILFNPDAKGLSPSSRKRIEIFQEQILQALENRCRTVYPVTPLRFSKLLLRLAPLKAASLEATQHLEVQRTLGNTKMDNIFNELLDFD